MCLEKESSGKWWTFANFFTGDKLKERGVSSSFGSSAESGNSNQSPQEGRAH